MRCYPLGIATAVAIVAIAGCSSGGEGGPASTQTTSTTATSSETHTPAPGAIEVSPGGVTTAVGADAESTEDEYSQACQAAKAWIDKQGGDRKSQIEPFLKTLQAPDAQPGPATYNTPWRSSPRPGRRPSSSPSRRAPTPSADSSNHGCEKVGYERPAIHSRPRVTAVSSAPKSGRWRARFRRRQARHAGRPARGCAGRPG